MIVAASVICASTRTKAEKLSLSLGLMFVRLTRGEVASFLSVQEAGDIGADELILATMTHGPEVRRRSYALAMEPMQEGAAVAAD